jgi:hypothetical protein
MLGNLTPEQRAEALEKARIAREEKKKAGEHLKQDFLDENYWRNLGSRLGVRLPASHIPNTETKYLKRIATKLNIDLKEYLEDSGCTTLKKLVALNSSFPAYAEVGLLLEWHNERMNCGH